MKTVTIIYIQHYQQSLTGRNYGFLTWRSRAWFFSWPINFFTRKVTVYYESLSEYDLLCGFINRSSERQKMKGSSVGMDSMPVKELVFMQTGQEVQFESSHTPAWTILINRDKNELIRNLMTIRSSYSHEKDINFTEDGLTATTLSAGMKLTEWPDQHSLTTI